MRLWSLHPTFLDAKGLVAVWREALLAQKVLQNRTRGYKHHPQLIRFRSQRNPLGCIAAYLTEIHAEASRRGYRFDASKVIRRRTRSAIPVTLGQIEYEFRHLLRKTKLRDRATHARLAGCGKIVPHPLFNVIDGTIEPWERPRRTTRTK